MPNKIRFLGPNTQSDIKANYKRTNIFRANSRDKIRVTIKRRWLIEKGKVDENENGTFELCEGDEIILNKTYHGVVSSAKGYCLTGIVLELEDGTQKGFEWEDVRSIEKINCMMNDGRFSYTSRWIPIVSHLHDGEATDSD